MLNLFKIAVMKKERFCVILPSFLCQSFGHLWGIEVEIWLKCAILRYEEIIRGVDLAY
ncbi:MAG: hypothetical protein WAO75_06350 [Atribacterales bacterium]